MKSDLSSIINERGKRTLEQFGKTIVAGVTHPGLRVILDDVKAYWKDTYRPALTSFSCEAVGGNPLAADDSSLMMTLMAAGLGIHDDIIDKSKNKHFRMTILGSHGLENSLLAGELLIVKALTATELLAKSCSPEKVANVIKTFEGFFIEVWESEYMEILCRRNLDTDLKCYQEILLKSTADTEACTRIGAMMGEGLPEEIEGLAKFGRRLGFVFRLVDEIKDTRNLEGNITHRMMHESVPLPILYASKSSKENHLRIETILKKKKIDSGDAMSLLRICFETDALPYVLEIARKNAGEGISQLHCLKPSFARTTLESMMDKAVADVSRLSL